jgi:NAD(P)H dehydrogenase (quinone)
MNILIIFAHPSKKSYTHQILEHLKKEFLQRKWSVEVSDLYAINFRSDMTEKEYEREAFSRIELPVSEDVANEHKKINNADCVIFLCPVWWSDCPAKLKGWFDRVFSVGFAYKQSDNLPKMKTMKYGVAICTAGYTNDLLKETGLAQSMENVMLNDRFGKRFVNKEMVILGGTLDVDKVKENHGIQIRELADKMSAI